MAHTPALIPALLATALVLGACSSDDTDDTDDAEASATTVGETDTEASPPDDEDAEPAPQPGETDGLESEPADDEVEESTGGTSVALEEVCTLLTDEEIQGFLGPDHPLDPEDPFSVGAFNDPSCTWSGVAEGGGFDLRLLGYSVTSDEWLPDDFAGNAMAFYPTEEAFGPRDTSLDAQVPQLGLGTEVWPGLGVYVRLSEGLWFSVSAGGITADTENPEALAVMGEIATLLAERL